MEKRRKKSQQVSGPAVSTDKPSQANQRMNGVLWVILAMVILVPLVTGTDLLNSTGKVVTFEVLGCVLAALIVSSLRFQGLLRRMRLNMLAGPNLPILLYCGFCLASYIITSHNSFSLMELFRVAFCAVIYFSAAYCLRAKADLQSLALGLLSITAVVSFFGFLQLGLDPGDGAAEGTFGSHELLGSFLMLMLPIALALGLIDRTDRRRQLFAQAVSVLALACLLIARTRSAWIGTGVGLIVLVLAFARWPRIATLPSLLRTKQAVVVPILVFGCAIFLFVALSGMGPSLSSRAETLSSLPTDTSFHDRVQMWAGTLKMIAAKPLAGWGIGSYPLHEYDFTGRGYPGTYVLQHGTDHRNIAHQLYLQTAAETGVLGLGLYLAVMIAFFVYGFRKLRQLDMGLRKVLLIGSLAATAAQAVDALGSPAYNFASVSLFQWLIMGIGMCAAGIGGPQWEAATVSAPARSSRGLRYALSGVAGVALLGCIVPTVSPALAITQQCGTSSVYYRLTTVSSGATDPTPGPFNSGTVVHFYFFQSTTGVGGTYHAFTPSSWGNVDLTSVSTSTNELTGTTSNNSPSSVTGSVTATVAGAGNPSVTASFTINAGQAPAAPTGLNATASPSTNSISLTWTASTGATSYTVLRSTTNGSGYVSIGTSSTASYTDSTVNYGTQYYYVVTATNSFGTSGNSTQATATTIKLAPSGVTATASGSNNDVTISGWSAIAGATSYTIFRGTASGGPYGTTVGSTANGSTTTLTDTTGNFNTTYYYVVQANYPAGASGNSNQATATTIPSYVLRITPNPGTVGRGSSATFTAQLSSDGGVTFNSSEPVTWSFPGGSHLSETSHTTTTVTISDSGNGSGEHDTLTATDVAHPTVTATDTITGS